MKTLTYKPIGIIHNNHKEQKDANSEWVSGKRKNFNNSKDDGRFSK